MPLLVFSPTTLRLVAKLFLVKTPTMAKKITCKVYDLQVIPLTLFVNEKRYGFSPKKSAPAKRFHPKFRN
jgi:hypothetical protein